jgi:hypothetical protein
MYTCKRFHLSSKRALLYTARETKLPLLMKNLDNTSRFLILVRLAIRIEEFVSLTITTYDFLVIMYVDVRYVLGTWINVKIRTFNRST